MTIHDTVIEACSSFTCHTILASKEEIDKYLDDYMYEDIFLLNIKNVPPCYKYGCLIFTDVDLAHVSYWIERCNGDELKSGLIFLEHNKTRYDAIREIH